MILAVTAAVTAQFSSELPCLSLIDSDTKMAHSGVWTTGSVDAGVLAVGVVVVTHQYKKLLLRIW